MINANSAPHAPGQALRALALAVARTGWPGELFFARVRSAQAIFLDDPLPTVPDRGHVPRQGAAHRETAELLSCRDLVDIMRQRLPTRIVRDEVTPFAGHLLSHLRQSIGELLQCVQANHLGIEFGQLENVLEARVGLGTIGVVTAKILV